MKKIIVIIILTILTTINFFAQSNRQMVMDDGFTFFDAEPVKGRNAQNSGDIDVGWYLKPSLRLMGTFSDNSQFRVVIKKGGKVVSNFTCTVWAYRKADDIQLKARKISGNFDDFVQTRACINEKDAIKEIGQMDVEIFFTDGGTEKLIRKHKIDVHKVANILGPKGSTYAGVSQYFIQRYAESSAGILHVAGGTYMYGSSISSKPFDFGQKGDSLFLYLPIVPDKRTYYKATLNCSVNGQNFEIPRNSIDLRRDSSAAYFYETALSERRDPKYSERITFAYLKAPLPISLGEVYTKTDISKKAGKWECKIEENGETYRLFHFEIGSNGQVVPHPEQQNGNINLYYKTYLVDVEIPTASSIDERLNPIPNAGIFYGISLTTNEAKTAAGKVPKKGNPYPVMPK